MRARFIVEEATPERVVISDVGTTQTSVTNDAEAVVEYLLNHGIVKPGQRLFYYDSEGNRDELLFNDKGFIDFNLNPDP